MPWRLLFLAALLPAAAVAAPPVARDAPVHISADRFHFDQKTGVGIYTGHVRVTQNTLTIDGDRLTVVAPPKGPVERLTMDGNPATFSDVTPKGKPVKGHAAHMLYLPDSRQIQLQGQAELSQERNTFSSTHIVYDTKNGVVTAGAPGHRVEATLVPDQGTTGKSAP
ncbi:lipopolysaccharide transport periplasmic protein LptA [Acidihalobacter prosperus]|uniref:Lipopolysaccharide export system protein LptA n=1 Tax=Acidihalobacter prosperus TaxID=160660 RepID=A0A1A6C3J1_9GAMM|nr:lipopolysaccharide transport periplasmic protein LptA [Acidihalobacter prosperus]OBS09110.1 lipopolysaccharide transport periplasmic protein LptA [Acidihalobacter prosperus]